MRTKSITIFSCAVAVLAFAGLSSAQLTTNQEHEWLNSPAASSHVGKFTGDAKAAAGDYRRYCVGCHGDLGDGNGENAPVADSQTARLPAGYIQVPLYSHRNFAYRSGLI